VILGVAVMTLGVVGVFRMPDVYTRLHAASKAVFLGVISIVLASFATQEPGIIWRVLLIGVLLLLTTPVAAHAIARAAFVEGERMRTTGAIDESGQRLDAPAERADTESAPDT
jgi:multicomponent Na+:H+ antiporter subunit G